MNEQEKFEKIKDLLHKALELSDSEIIKDNRGISLVENKFSMIFDALFILLVKINRTNVP
jgi:hypothetical protein